MGSAKCLMKDQNEKHTSYIYNRPKGRFGVNYIVSMASYLGCVCYQPIDGEDIVKADVTIECIKKNDPGWKMNPKICFQVKTTSSPDIKDGFLHYNFKLGDIEVMNANSQEHLLAVLCISDDPDMWVRNTKYGVVMEKEMYWYNPRVYDYDPNCESESVVLKIPVENKLTLDALSEMLTIVGKGGDLKNELPNK